MGIHESNQGLHPLIESTLVSGAIWSERKDDLTVAKHTRPDAARKAGLHDEMS